MTEDALDELRKHCKRIGHGSVKPLVKIKDGIAVEIDVQMGDVTIKLRAKKKT